MAIRFRFILLKNAKAANGTCTIHLQCTGFRMPIIVTSNTYLNFTAIHSRFTYTGGMMKIINTKTVQKKEQFLFTINHTSWMISDWRLCFTFQTANWQNFNRSRQCTCSLTSLHSDSRNFSLLCFHCLRVGNYTHRSFCFRVYSAQHTLRIDGRQCFQRRTPWAKVRGDESTRRSSDISRRQHDNFWRVCFLLLLIFKGN